MTKERLTTTFMALAIAASMYAQAEPELKVKPSGRILFDAAFVDDREELEVLHSGIGNPDMRIGVGFSYDRWKGKIDLGFADNDVNILETRFQVRF